MVKSAAQPSLQSIFPSYVGTQGIQSGHTRPPAPKETATSVFLHGFLGPRYETQFAKDQYGSIQKTEMLKSKSLAHGLLQAVSDHLERGEKALTPLKTIPRKASPKIFARFNNLMTDLGSFISKILSRFFK